MIWPLSLPVEPGATEIVRTVLPASVNDVPEATLKPPPVIVNVLSPEGMVAALSVTKAPPVRSSSAIVWVGTFVMIGLPVLKTNTSSGAGTDRIGDQFVDTCQSVVNAGVPPIHV